ncbi:MAG: hypothetical protein FWC03_04850 [Treponema sp.]|nr:hypothetical protein [Treponema sp.]
MKKNILALMLIVCVFFCVYGQNSSPIDLILVLDTSSAMGSSYTAVNDYITGAFLAEYLRLGDTFHLITFSDVSRLDTARRILGSGDVETIIGRMMLRYPVEAGCDVEAAISFSEEYISSLPSRQKKIVLVTIGSGNVSALVTDANTRLNSNDAALYLVSVIPGQPLVNLPVSGRPAVRRPAAVVQTPVQTPAPAPVQTQAPAPIQTPAPVPVQTQAPAIVETPVQVPVQTPTPAAVEAPAQTALVTAETQTPVEIPTPTPVQTQAPAQTQEQTPAHTPEPVTTQDPPAAEKTPAPSVSAQTPAKTEKARSEFWSSPVTLIIGIIILALLLLGLLVFFIVRKLNSSPKHVIVSATVPESEKKKKSLLEKAEKIKREEAVKKDEPIKREEFIKKDEPAKKAEPVKKTEPVKPVDHVTELASYAAAQTRQRTTPYSDRPVKIDVAKTVKINPDGPLMLNLFVEDQNTSIGKRNIHSLKSGYSLSIGGGKSDFLIFLVPMPVKIGEIRRNGSQLTFIPRKPKYFPDLGSKEMKDCINQTIRIVSEKNYEMRFRFEMYEDPLIELHRVLNSVKVPG